MRSIIIHGVIVALSGAAALAQTQPDVAEILKKAGETSFPFKSQFPMKKPASTPGGLRKRAVTLCGTMATTVPASCSQQSR